ncbi:hypothetical protein [Noviherbaspirillum sp. UKPF54]|uniref:hypothetical protein n=1 Tax=Noviherbaspirillum sp. UKPF54 TaxID=2601898 RepID=UPI0011B1A8C3|nr:hypothetical protein [Noviherbaspirillum sp. UKPF54]QDZ29337.1 hypothetical protein FAY22_16050 [Noviherbaspirillum sp. UKPF54]
MDTETSKGFWTRDIISNGIKNKWRKKEAILYRNIDSALRTSSLFSPCPANAFTEVAFMNYFQRPADTNGDSIQVHQQDAQVANEVFRAVVHAISPDIVIFCSSLAYRNAKKFEVPNFLNLRNVLCGHVPHAGMPWWNRVAKKYGGRTGKQVFADFIEQKVLLELKRTA